MKRSIAPVLAGVLLCSSLMLTDSAYAADNGSSEPMQIVATIFPEYDWIKNILGDNPGEAQVTLLLDKGVDLHSYQPSAEDILKISTCDLFVYVGGESDSWVKDALKEAVNEDMIVVNLLDVLGDEVKEEELAEGMQKEEHAHDRDDADDHDDEMEDRDDADDHDDEMDDRDDADDHDDEMEDHDDADDHDDDMDDHDDADDHDDDIDDHDDTDDHEEHDHYSGEVEYDEHVWLSLRNASVFVDFLADVLEQIDPDNAQNYDENADSYQEKLEILDEEYREAVKQASYSTLLFGDRFPFRYLTDDYDLDYYAAFAGCSAETNASFETVIFLAQKLDELGLPAVLTIEGTDHRVAETIIQNTKKADQAILVVDSMQATTAKDIENGADYYSIMKNNLEVIKEAIN